MIMSASMPAASAPFVAMPSTAAGVREHKTEASANVRPNLLTAFRRQLMWVSALPESASSGTRRTPRSALIATCTPG